MSDTLGIGKAAQAAKDLIAPVYSDLAQPAIREVGSAAATTVRAILLPLHKAAEHYSDAVERLSTSIGKKLAQLPPERVTPPPAYIAGPVLEAVRFIDSESPLHEMYSTLLANSMDSESVKIAHPAFVSVIQQLSPDEARILQHFAVTQVESVPMIWIVGTYQQEAPSRFRETWIGAERTVTALALDAGCEAPEFAPAYADNLVRVGVLERIERYELTESTLYERLESLPLATAARERIEAQPGHKCEMRRGIFALTEFGKLLIAAAVSPRAR